MCIFYCSVAQSVTCLATDASLTADPGVASSIPARSHTFVEIDHEIISTVILLPSAESFKQGCCQLQAKVCARSMLSVTSESMCTKYWLTACSSLTGKRVDRLSDTPAMTIAVDMGRKATKQTNKIYNWGFPLFCFILLLQVKVRERSGSVVECLTRDRRAAGSSLTGVTALCP